jgi:RNA polymerase sigma factor (sigma-70 family)
VSIFPSSPPSAAGTKQARWFEDEVYPHDGQLKAYLRGRFPAERDIDDVVQESFVRLLKARATTPIRSVKAFLFRVARNVAIDRHRRSRSGVEVPAADVATHNVIDETADITATIGAIEKERVLATALAALPERAYEVVVLCKFDGLSHGAAAERLGISKRTVDEHVRRGMKRLGNELRQRGMDGLFEP